MPKATTRMHKALLFSLLFATLWFPIRASKVRNLRASATEAIVGFSVFAALYWLALMWVYPALKS
jgi:hypothetical protein